MRFVNRPPRSALGLTKCTPAPAGLVTRPTQPKFVPLQTFGIAIQWGCDHVGEAVIHFTPQARTELHDDEALVFDWHRVAICCAVAGEVSLRSAPRHKVEHSGSFRQLPSDQGTHVYAHRMAVPHLARRDVTIDCRRTLGMRRFRSDLPPDFGLRAVFGRAGETTSGGIS